MVNGISGIKTIKGLSKSGININGGDKFKKEMDKIRSTSKLTQSQHENPIDNITSKRINKLNLEQGNINKEEFFKEIIYNLDVGHKKIENILKISLSGVKLNQQELLTLQMRVYRFTQEVELISKLVEKGTSGIKQVVNTQV